MLREAKEMLRKSLLEHWLVLEDAFKDAALIGVDIDQYRDEIMALVESVNLGAAQSYEESGNEHYSCAPFHPRGAAESLLAYIKSLWSFSSIACQGSRHMSCMN